MRDGRLLSKYNVTQIWDNSFEHGTLHFDLGNITSTWKTLHFNLGQFIFNLGHFTLTLKTLHFTLGQFIFNFRHFSFHFATHF